VIRRSGLAVSAVIALAAPAAAELTETGEHGFTISHSFEVEVAPATAWAALTDVSAWWDPVHSYSGDAARFSLEPSAGGCFCEIWNGGSVVHAEVLQAHDRALLRLSGALGPLQAMGLSSIHDWTLEPTDIGTRITYTNRVRGWPGDSLDELAPIVDGVQVGQMERLRRYIATGDPDTAE
jgi:uncharacterized protein YndB with AHSA1/START domain